MSTIQTHEPKDDQLAILGAKKISQNALKNTFILWYRSGNNPHSLFKFFEFPSSDIQAVVQRVKRHCEVMNIRFVRVHPAWADLDLEENVLTNKDV